MVLHMMGRDMRAMDPMELLFWGVMSLGVAVGFAVAYPFNVWMVSQQMKHGVMTQRGPAGRHDHAMPAPDGKAPRKAAKSSPAASSPMQHDMGAMKMVGPSAHSDAKSADDHPMKPSVTWPQLAAMTFLTGLMLLVGMTFPP